MKQLDGDTSPVSIVYLENTYGPLGQEGICPLGTNDFWVH